MITRDRDCISNYFSDILVFGNEVEMEIDICNMKFFHMSNAIKKVITILIR